MESNTIHGKTFTGLVMKISGKNTISVRVDRYVPHPKYKKYQVRSKNFLVHDPENTAAVGDKVTIQESRPLSKSKHFVLIAREARAVEAE